MHILTDYVYIACIIAGRSGLALACLTAVREVLGSYRAVGSCVYRKTTVIYIVWHGLCAPFQFLQCVGQLSLLPYVGMVVWYSLLEFNVPLDTV